MITSLLRPFNLEAAAKGELLCSTVDSYIYEFIASGKPDVYGQNVTCRIVDVKDPSVRHCVGTLVLKDSNHLRMCPLCWVEEKPVYKGDKLYDTSACENRGIVIAEGYEEGDLLVKGYGAHYIGYLSWKQPKVKKTGWVNISSAHAGRKICSRVFETKAQAEKCQSRNHLACTFIEWEE